MTLLNDGSLLVVGGVTRGLTTSVQRVIPATGQWFDTGSLRVARARHTTTLLTDGTVLVTGGDGSGLSGAATGAVERFDPATGRWSSGPALAVARQRHRAVLLSDGTVLVVGGIEGWRAGDHLINTTERYDPTTQRWHSAAQITTARADCALIRLVDGRILAVGGQRGVGVDAEIYDPSRDTWTPTTAPGYSHYSAQMALLADGRVLVASSNDRPEIYEPARDTWTPIAPVPFLVDAVVRMATGNDIILAIGSRAIARYGTQSAGWQTPVALATPRGGGVAIPLPDGTLVLVGGGALRGDPTPPPIEIFRP